MMPIAPTSVWRPPRVLVGCLVVAVLLRIIAIIVIRWHPFVDDAWYLQTATEMATGRGYAYQGRATAYFPVGYPAILACVFKLVGPSLRAAQVVNVVLSFGTMICTYAIGRTLTGNTSVGALAAMMMGFMPNQILSCCITMSEISFTFLMTLGIAIALRKNWCRAELWGLLVGALFGLSSLVRPQCILVPFIVVPLASCGAGSKASAKRVLVRLGVVAIGLAVVVAPWTYRNYRVFDAFVLVSTNGGDNLLIGNNAAAKRADPQVLYPPGVEFAHMSELERDRFSASLARSYIRAQPLQALARIPTKVWQMYRSDLGVTDWIWVAHGKPQSPLYYAWRWVTQVCYLAVLVGAFLWIAAHLSMRRSATAELRSFLYIVVAMTGYFTLITAVFFGDARYHQPLMPLLALAAATLVIEWGGDSNARAGRVTGFAGEAHPTTSS
jgi:4-amino-4-deoxy-L-arabinose transferase-like glycosyltransferase